MKQIVTSEDYNKAMAEIEVYLVKGFDNLTPEEEDALEVISKSVSEYEQIHFPMPVEESGL